jgi:hypothetical protein
MSSYPCTIDYPNKPYTTVSSFIRILFLVAIISTCLHWYILYMAIPLLLLILALPAIFSIIFFASIHPNIHIFYRFIILSCVHIELYILGVRSVWMPFSESLKLNADIQLPSASQPLKRSYLVLKPILITPAIIGLTIISILIPLLMIFGLFVTLFNYEFPKRIHAIVRLFYIYYFRIACYGLFFLTDEWPIFKRNDT